MKTNLLSYMDQMTYKTISYRAEDNFIISVRLGTGRQKIIKVFKSNEIVKVLDTFHKLPIDSTFMKYLYISPTEFLDGDSQPIYRQRGQASSGTIPPEIMLKVKRKEKKKTNTVKCNIRVSSLNVGTLKTLNELDWGNYGMSSVLPLIKLTKLMLNYFCYLEPSERKILLAKANKAYELLNDGDGVSSKIDELL